MDCLGCGKPVPDTHTYCPGANGNKCRAEYWRKVREAGKRALGITLPEIAAGQSPGVLPKPMGKMHASSVSSSEKLRKVLSCLLDRPHTTIEIQDRTGLCSISTWVSMLRKNGYSVNCEMVQGGKDKIYKYTLIQ